MKNKTIIFDLYNTLLRNTIRNHPYLTLYKSIEEHNNTQLSSRDFFNYCMINNGDINYIISKLNLKVDTQDLNLFKANLKEEFNSIIFNQELINEFKNYEEKKVLLSNLSFEYQEPISELEKLITFDSKIYSFETGLLKPQKEIFLKAADSVGSSVKDCIMFGDNMKLDIDGAKKIGMQTRLVEQWWD